MVATIGATLASSLFVPALALRAWHSHLRQIAVDRECRTKWPSNANGWGFCQHLWADDPTEWPVE
jgi:hypothetical protein